MASWHPYGPRAPEPDFDEPLDILDDQFYMIAGPYLPESHPMYQPRDRDHSLEWANHTSYQEPARSVGQQTQSYPYQSPSQEQWSHPGHQIQQQPQDILPAKEGKSQKLNRAMNRISKPLNKAAAKMGCEAFNPQEMELEMEKCARILRSFCIDGFMTTTSTESNDAKSDTSSTSSSKKNGLHGRERKALHKIPAKVIQNCKGLAIFTSMRFGWQLGGGNGCGILIRHLPDGSWSAPSGIHMANLTYGLVAGLDVYDCVAVINTEKGLEGFTKVRGTIGVEVAATAGPLGAGAIGDLEVSKRVSPVWTYTKNRGFYVGAHLNGTIFIERTNENPRFYGQPGIRHAEILSGNIKAPECCNVLYQTLAAIEGKTYDEKMLPPPPSYEDAVENDGGEYGSVDKQKPQSDTLGWH